MNTGKIIDTNIQASGKELLWTQAQGGSNVDWQGEITTQQGIIIGLVALMLCIFLTLAVFAINYGIEKVKNRPTIRSGYQRI